MADGSGLSRRNRLTAGGITDLLATMARGPQADAWNRSLPAWGEEGTSLRHRPPDPVLEGRVVAKTGKLHDARALSGYVTTRGGRRLAFSLLVNRIEGIHWPVLAWQADLCRRLVGYDAGDGSGP